MNIPNILTLVRISLIPVFVMVYYLPLSWAHMASTLIFSLAAITDWLDGYLARNLKQTSLFGAFLDPVADKLMVAVALVLLVSDPHHSYIALPAAIIICREIAVSALREWMAELGKRTSVAVSLVGKLKTIFQMVALILLLLYTPASSFIIGIVGYFSLYTAACLTLWSMIMYLRAAWPDLTLRQKQ